MLSAPWTSRHHEKMSVDLLEDILGGEQSHTISRYLNEEEIGHIKDMITSEKGGQPAPPGKRWLYEVGPALLSISESAHALSNTTGAAAATLAWYPGSCLSLSCGMLNYAHSTGRRTLSSSRLSSLLMQLHCRSDFMGTDCRLAPPGTG